MKTVKPVYFAVRGDICDNIINDRRQKNIVFFVKSVDKYKNKAYNYNS